MGPLLMADAAIGSEQARKTVHELQGDSRGGIRRGVSGPSTPRAARVRMHPQQAAVVLQLLQNSVQARSTSVVRPLRSLGACRKRGKLSRFNHSGDHFALRFAVTARYHTSEKVLLASGDGWRRDREGGISGSLNWVRLRFQGTTAAMHTTTSKQACEQWAQSSLPCDGSNPCDCDLQYLFSFGVGLAVWDPTSTVGVELELQELINGRAVAVCESVMWSAVGLGLAAHEACDFELHGERPDVPRAGLNLLGNARIHVISVARGSASLSPHRLLGGPCGGMIDDTTPLRASASWGRGAVHFLGGLWVVVVLGGPIQIRWGRGWEPDVVRQRKRVEGGRVRLWIRRVRGFETTALRTSMGGTTTPSCITSPLANGASAVGVWMRRPWAARGPCCPVVAPVLPPCCSWCTCAAAPRLCGYRAELAAPRPSQSGLKVPALHSFFPSFLGHATDGPPVFPPSRPPSQREGQQPHLARHDTSDSCLLTMYKRRAVAQFYKSSNELEVGEEGQEMNDSPPSAPIIRLFGDRILIWCQGI
ncbi:hypothetical protein DFH06DRAFT_1124039 [Mycena polygramma]|nr:hypothetical protein DFH06DRAFT_1124039 [Mycena polygramma]